MAKVKEKKSVYVPVEDRKDLKHLSIYVVIVPKGQGQAMIRLMQDYNSSMQFLHVGYGTASKEVLEILGIQDNQKDIVTALVTPGEIREIKKEIEAFFEVNKKKRGIAFTIPLSSLVGVKVYHFLTNTI